MKYKHHYNFLGWLFTLLVPSASTSGYVSGFVAGLIIGMLYLIFQPSKK